MTTFRHSGQPKEWPSEEHVRTVSLGGAAEREPPCTLCEATWQRLLEARARYNQRCADTLLRDALDLAETNYVGHRLQRHRPDGNGTLVQP